MNKKMRFALMAFVALSSVACCGAKRSASGSAPADANSAVVTDRLHKPNAELTSETPEGELKLADPVTDGARTDSAPVSGK